MKGTILLNSNENTKLIEEEEQSRFVKGILEILGVPIQEIWVGENKISDLSYEDKSKLRALMSAYQIKVIDIGDGHLQVYVEDNLIGEWNKCTYILKRDPSALDPKNQLYLEMNFDYWHLFEGPNNNEE